MRSSACVNVFIASLFVGSSIMMSACSSSGDSAKESTLQPLQPSATEMIQKELSGLRVENDSLKRQLSKLQEYNRSVLARSAELETQLAELKERMAEPIAKIASPSAPATTPKPPATTKPVATTKSAAATTPITTNSQSAYDNSLSLFRSRNYREALGSFQAILDAGTAGNLESNCHYWLGECAYATKNYKNAIEYFQRVFGYARTTKRDDAQIMIANCYSRLGNRDKAKTEYEKVIEKYPASPYAKRAKVKLGHL